MGRPWRRREHLLPRRRRVRRGHRPRRTRHHPTDQGTDGGYCRRMSRLVVDAPIVAVTVYPGRARVTRRGRITMPAGDQTLYVEALPLSLEGDSVRVAGRGPATVLGVDVATEHHAQ